MSIAAELHALQDLDLALDRARARLQEIEEGLAETEELQAARLAMEEKTKVVKALKARQSDLEWEVDEVRTKAADVEGKLYGGKVTSPKELSDLDADLKSLRTQTAKREDVLLTHLVELEDAESERMQSAGEYAELETSWQSHHDQLLEEREKLRPHADDLTAKREQRAAGTEKRAIALYSVLRERKGGLAVARVEQGMCQGCRITLPGAVLQAARGSAGLVQCVSCERILLVS